MITIKIYSYSELDADSKKVAIEQAYLEYFQKTFPVKPFKNLKTRLKTKHLDLDTRSSNFLLTLDDVYDFLRITDLEKFYGTEVDGEAVLQELKNASYDTLYLKTTVEVVLKYSDRISTKYPNLRCLQSKLEGIIQEQFDLYAKDIALQKTALMDEKYISKYMDSVNFLFFKNGVKFLHNSEITCEDLYGKNRNFNIDKKSIG